MNKILNQFTIDPKRFSRLLSFTYCYLILIFITVTVGWYMYITTTPKNMPPFPIRVLDVILAGALLSYIPLVFIGIAPSVILESVVRNPSTSGVLSISRDSWQNDFLFPGYAGKTMCSHCWQAAGRMIITLYAGVIVCAIFPILIILQALIILLIIPFSMIFNKEMETWSFLWRRMWSFHGDFEDIFTGHRRREIPYKRAAPPVPLTKFQVFAETTTLMMKQFFIQSGRTLWALKQRACPIVRIEYDSKD
jgi:hypothetical protein